MSLFSFFKNKSNRHNQIFGNFGEDIAKNFLLENKYKILTANFRCRSGEIDLIAEKNKTISFIEVKTRSSTGYGHPEEAVTHAKQKHIINSARYYISQHSFPENYNFQADIIAVLITKDEYQTQYFPNAFPLYQ